MNRAPPNADASTRIVPPWKCTCSSAIARPRPVPTGASGLFVARTRGGTDRRSPPVPPGDSGSRVLHREGERVLTHADKDLCRPAPVLLRVHEQVGQHPIDASPVEQKRAVTVGLVDDHVVGHARSFGGAGHER